MADPFSKTAWSHALVRPPPPRTEIGTLLKSSRGGRRNHHLSFSHPGPHAAGRNTTPCGISPIVAIRQSAMRSLRASATIIVLRRRGAPSTRALNQPLLAPPRAALVGRPGDPGVARHGAIAPTPRHHLVHQHVRRLDAETKRASEGADRRVGPVVRSVLNAFEPRFLDCGDLLAQQAARSS
jgi:hypothetical protein